MPEKPIFFLKESRYSGSAPAYYQLSDFPAARLLEDNWQVIKDEMLLSHPAVLRSPIYNPNQDKNADKWKMVIFYNYLWKKKENCKKYPKTYNILQQIDGLTFAAFNLLEPHSEIKPHYGDTNTTIRCHLGIDIPASLPQCGVEVAGQQKGWQNGGILLFSDAHYHRAWNYTNHKRYVFVVDIIRPEYRDRKKWICAGVLGSLTIKTVTSRFAIINKIPGPVMEVIFLFLRACWWLKIV